MKTNKLYLVSLLSLCISLMAFTMPSMIAQAQESTQDNGNCINCHENLYYLHDTGNWFCLKDSPMRCVDCHGGNPAATTKETAHYDRSAHPVIGEDISRCETCHIDCAERLTVLDEKVGISEVKEATYIPASDMSNPTGNLPAEEPYPINWALVFDIVPLVILGMAAVTIYLLKKVRHV